MIGFIPARCRLLVKFDRAKQITVIGHRDRRHLEFRRLFHQLLHPDRAIEQRIFGVQMEMNERIARHQFQYKRRKKIGKFTRHADRMESGRG